MPRRGDLPAEDVPNINLSQVTYLVPLRPLLYQAILGRRDALIV